MVRAAVKKPSASFGSRAMANVSLAADAGIAAASVTAGADAFAAGDEELAVLAVEHGRLDTFDFAADDAAREAGMDAGRRPHDQGQSGREELDGISLLNI